MSSKHNNSKGASIKATDLGKIFRGHHGNTTVALQSLYIEMGEREFVSIVGPSGLWKSTFLLILAGLEKPTNGKITIDGKTVKGPDPQGAVVFQEYLLFPWKTVMGNVEFDLQLKGVPKSERRVIASQFIDLVDLNGFEEQYPHQLKWRNETTGSHSACFDQ